MAYEINAKWEALYYSPRAAHSFTVRKHKEVRDATDGNDLLRDKGHKSASLMGGDGHDAYRIYNSRTTVIEHADYGIDSITTWMNYAPPANVANMILSGDNLYAYGNDLDNIVAGGAGRQTINGFEGNDVLKGGAESDTFVILKGNGSDVVLDFEAGRSGDVASLETYGFYTFNQVVAAMAHHGPDVHLSLTADESLVFRNQAIENFTDENFSLPAAPEDDIAFPTPRPESGGLVFSDDFDALSLYDGTSGTWKSTYFWGDRTLAGNGEREFYVDPNFEKLGITPYGIDDGILTISARPTADSLKQYTDLPYTSGLITSEQSFAMQYGYFEMRAELPAGQGLWPAFWLLPINGKWPPELDVMEVLGHDMNTLHTAAHTKETGAHTSTGAAVEVPDLSEGFHTYGVNWQRDEITWYFDGAEVSSAPTPADMHLPMYMIANLTVGGYWPGNPDETTPFPAQMKIDYIRAYQTPSDGEGPPVPKQWAPIDLSAFSSLDTGGAKTVWDWNYTMPSDEVKIQLSEGGVRFITGNDSDNYMIGVGAQYTELRSGKGNDVIEGGVGTDVFVFRAGDGYDVIRDFSNTEGNRDMIYLEELHFAHFDGVRPWLSQVGHDTLLRLAEDQAVLLENIVPSELRADQFAFLDPIASTAGSSQAYSDWF